MIDARCGSIGNRGGRNDGGERNDRFRGNDRCGRDCVTMVAAVGLRLGAAESAGDDESDSSCMTGVDRVHLKLPYIKWV